MMETTNLTTQQNAAIAAQFGGLFKDINFAGLSSIIETLGKNNCQLTPEEKKLAVGIVEDWQNSVIRRLEEKRNENYSFLGFFNENSCTTLENEMMEALAQATGTIKEYTDYTDAMQAETDHLANYPESPVEDLTTTADERLTHQRDYDLAIAKHNITAGKLARNTKNAMKAWKKVLLANQAVKDMVAKATKFSKNVNKLKYECEDKTRMAKLNISIASEDVRNSLRDLLDFAKQL